MKPRKPTHPDNQQEEFDDNPPRRTRPLTADEDDALDYQRERPYPEIPYYIQRMMPGNLG